jgi:hypothetical protein
MREGETEHTSFQNQTRQNDRGGFLCGRNYPYNSTNINVSLRITLGDTRRRVRLNGTRTWYGGTSTTVPVVSMLRFLTMLCLLSSANRYTQQSPLPLKVTVSIFFHFLLFEGTDTAIVVEEQK